MSTYSLVLRGTLPGPEEGFRCFTLPTPAELTKDSPSSRVDRRPIVVVDPLYGSPLSFPVPYSTLVPVATRDLTGVRREEGQGPRTWM